MKKTHTTETQNYRNIIDSISDILITVDHNLEFKFLNSYAEDLALYPCEKKSILDIYPMFKNSKGEKIFKEALSNGEPQTFMQDFIIKGEIKVIELKVYPSPEGLTIIGRDLRTYKKTDDSRRYNEQLFRKTLDTLLEGCAIFGYDWRYLYVNESNARHAHSTRENLLGKRLQDVFPGIESTIFFETYKIVMEQRIPKHIESDFNFPDGTKSWYEVKVVPIPEGIFLLSSDITERKIQEEKILRYQSILNQSEKLAHLGSWWIDFYHKNHPEKNILGWSEEVYRIFGYEPFSINLTEEFFYNCVHPEDREVVSEEIERAVLLKSPLYFEHRIVRPNGEIRKVVEHAVIKSHKKGEVISIVGAIQDITEFRRAMEERERLLQDISNERDKLKTIIECVPEEVWVLDSDNKKIMVNNAVKNGLGLGANEDLDLDYVISAMSIKSIDGDIRQREETPLLRGLKGESVNGEEMITNPLSGEIRYRQFHTAPIKNKENKVTGVVGIARDITEQRKNEEFIKTSLREKEVLLRELYHRTKNNMQVISSLLKIKAAAVGDSKLVGIVEEMNNRIKAISLVHQKLYQSNNLSRIDLGEYISDLTSLLFASYSASPDKIDIHKNLQSVQVLLDTAIPLGLIVNELVSNTLKHAFPGNKKGNLYLDLKRTEENSIEIKICDDGIGFTNESNGGEEKLGLQLFKILAKDQLNGTIELDNSHGTSWRILLKDESHKERV